MGKLNTSTWPRQTACVILAVPAAIAVGMWQGSLWAGLAGHAVVYLLFSIDLRLLDLLNAEQRVENTIKGIINEK